jgi:PD-(D/E)XK nuclease superfamily
MSEQSRLPLDEPKRPQLHATALSFQCGEAFRRRYLEGDIIPPGVAALVGHATDRAVTENLRHKMRTRELLPVEAVADHARDDFEHGWHGGVRLEEHEVQAGLKRVKGANTDKAVRLAVLHAKLKAPEIEPTHLQRKWSLELPGYPMTFVGTLDIQEGGYAIRDTKTSGKSPQRDVADTSLQLTAYHLAVKVLDGTAPEHVILDYLLDLKTPKAVSIEATREAEDYRPLLARIEVVSKALESGLFLPVSPDHWMCCARWCGYFSSCRYAMRPKSVQVPVAVALRRIVQEAEKDP